MVRVALLLFLTIAATEWKVAVPDYPWAFPRDHWAHDGYRTEWWYFTGHLETEDASRRFGYQFTFFRIGVLNEPPELDSDWTSTSVIMGHAAITDLASGEHVFSEVFYREMPLLASFSQFSSFSAYPEPVIGWSRGPAGTGDLWTLAWNGNGFDVAARDVRQGMGFRLETETAKPVVFHGPNGFSRKSDELGRGAASQYYSLTRLVTSGEVELGGERFRVTGESWMDKEFSSSHLAENQVGWDWFSLQLDDGRELMLYLMREADGTVDYAAGTLIDTGGEARYLMMDEFDVDVLEHWTSPETGARYPSRWRVRLPEAELELEITSLAADQENRSRLPSGVYYWEGAVSVSGGETGRGFVELAGYGEGNRPPV